MNSYQSSSSLPTMPNFMIIIPFYTVLEFSSLRHFQNKAGTVIVGVVEEDVTV